MVAPTTRTQAKREATVLHKKRTVWRRSGKLDVPDWAKKEGYRMQWARRTKGDGQPDDMNLMEYQDAGFLPVPASEIPEGTICPHEKVNTFGDVICYGSLMLMRISNEDYAAVQAGIDETNEQYERSVKENPFLEQAGATMVPLSEQTGRPMPMSA